MARRKKIKMDHFSLELMLSNMIGEIGGYWHHNMRGNSSVDDMMRYHVLYVVTRTHVTNTHKAISNFDEDHMNDRHRMLWHKTKEFMNCLETFPNHIHENPKEVERFCENFVPWIKACLTLIDTRTSQKEAEAVANS